MLWIMQLSFKNYKKLSIPRTLPLGEYGMMPAPGCGSAAWRNSRAITAVG